MILVLINKKAAIKRMQRAKFTSSIVVSLKLIVKKRGRMIRIKFLFVISSNIGVIYQLRSNKVLLHNSLITTQYK